MNTQMKENKNERIEKYDGWLKQKIESMNQEEIRIAARDAVINKVIRIPEYVVELSYYKKNGEYVKDENGNLKMVKQKVKKYKKYFITDSVAMKIFSKYFKPSKNINPAVEWLSQHGAKEVL